MDKTINNVISKLKTLGKIESGQNLIISDNLFHIYDCHKSQMDRLSKWWHQETRYTTITKLDGFYLEIKDICNTLLADPIKNNVVISRFHRELVTSLIGLDNLKSTYQTDKTTCSQIETLHENLNVEIERLHVCIENNNNILN